MLLLKEIIWYNCQKVKKTVSYVSRRLCYEYMKCSSLQESQCDPGQCTKHFYNDLLKNYVKDKYQSLEKRKNMYKSLFYHAYKPFTLN